MGLGGLASLGCAAFAWRSRIRLADAVSGWSRAEGEILTAEVIVHRTADGDAYEPRVCYAYDFAGFRLGSDQLRVGARQILLSNRDFAAAAIARYHRGTKVVVHVDPTNHSHSALEVEPVTSGLKLRLAVSLTLLAAAASLWITLA
jgi:hypothetical protein